MVRLIRREPAASRDALIASSRLKARISALLEAALEHSGLSQAALAERLGIRKAAVNNVLRGDGNVTIDTLADYLYAMGFEADVVAVVAGEILASMQDRRAPEIAQLTIRDRDRNRSRLRTITNSTLDWTGDDNVAALRGPGTTRPINVSINRNLA